MKLAASISGLLVCLGFASVASAATCNATQATITSTASVNGNTCGHNSNFNGGTFCNGVSFSNTGTDAYQIQLAANQNFTFTVSSPGAGSAAFTPDIALVGSCADNGACIAENTTGTGTVTDPFSGTITGNAAGTYFIFITDSSGLGAGCGDYTLSFSGTLPVKLQDFSVD